MNLINPIRPFRFAALALLILTVVHVLFLYGIPLLELESYRAKESPIWFNVMFLIRGQLNSVLEVTLSFPQTGLILVGLTGALTILLYRSSSRLLGISVLMVWLSMAMWEAYFRASQLQFVLAEGFVIGPPMVVGCVGAAAGLLAVMASSLTSFFALRRSVSPKPV